ncbi:MAG TPA: serine/threonine-protein kinase, partial [Kofleriaceae bacterium]
MRGTVVDDQYRIERVLGEGGMGTVYVARDLRLDRDVALKLAHERSPQALARSTREALVLARLSHPNVVAIYQVGVYDQWLYVAMEYVRGMTARAWTAEPRTVREILAVYIAVGEGLAAAHRAGVVHHDFKPDNVIVGDDGRARVLDFGLARTATDSERGNRIAGTPGYMAPEQQRGDAIDHRADQYAFCASLWEAMHHSLPYDSDAVRTLSLGTVETSQPTTEPLVMTTRVPKLGKPSVPLPRHVEAALKRGLSDDREQRWPEMAPLLEELRRDPSRARKRVAAIAGGIAIVAGAGVAVAWPAHREDPCRVGPDLIARTWSAEHRAQVATQLANHAPAWL